jgi:hypothetical protein
MPGISSVGAMAYRRIATQRFICDAHCRDEAPERGSSLTLPAVSPSRNLLCALGASVLVIVASSVWLNQVEYYPISAWQMYSDHGRELSYFKTLAIDESGAASTIYLDRPIPALADGRVANALLMCFEPNKTAICRNVLRTIISVLNEHASAGRRITGLVIQRMSWDFLSNPSDPAHGNVVESFLFRDNDAPPTIGRR